MYLAIIVHLVNPVNPPNILYVANIVNQANTVYRTNIIYLENRANQAKMINQANIVKQTNKQKKKEEIVKECRSPVGWCCSMHRKHLSKEAIHEFPRYDIKPLEDQAPVLKFERM